MTRFWEFLTLEGPLLKVALLGSCLLAMNSALLGSILVVRRMAMTSDTLSHAVLPGIMAGYLWNLTKDPTALLVGAVISGLLGTLLLNAITATTKLRADAAQGIVLSFFLGLGVCIFQRMKVLPTGNRAGLDQFLFGQMAGLEGRDVWVLAGATGLSLLTLTLGYRGILVLSFDRSYGLARGLPMRVLHAWFMFLTTVAIVVSMESVGVVLISALMVIPASAAGLLTKRLGPRMAVAAGFGVISAILGAGASYCFSQVAAGPAVVLASSFCFTLAFLFSPENGALARWGRKLHWQRQVRCENALKDIYRWLEDQEQPETTPFSMASLAKNPRFKTAEIPKLLQQLSRAQFLEPCVAAAESTLQLSLAGRGRARELVRAHRLWELYLTERASYATDHVHEDAEEIEHMLTVENLENISQLLGNPTHDPHGRIIPPLLSQTP